MGIVVTVYSMVQHAQAPWLRPSFPALHGRNRPFRPLPLAARVAQGKTCFVSLANSLLGMLMYASYFALFLQLFLSHYVYNTKGAPPAAKAKHEPLLEPHCPPALSAAADGAAKARPVAGKRQSKEQ